MTEIKHLITEAWEEQLLEKIVGEERVEDLLYPIDEFGNETDYFDPSTEYLEITIKRVPK